jgi:TRAP-type C4-dicarboxylate transport system permease small subunit
MLKSFNHGLRAAAALSVAAMLVIVTANVLARYVFNAPLHWAEEVSALILILVGFFPAAYLWEKGGHVSFDLISKKLSARRGFWPAIVTGFTSLAGILFSAVLAWQGCQSAWLSYRQNIREPSLLGTPLWVLQIIMFLGALALLSACVKTFIEAWKRR